MLWPCKIISTPSCCLHLIEASTELSAKQAKHLPKKGKSFWEPARSSKRCCVRFPTPRFMSTPPIGQLVRRPPAFKDLPTPPCPICFAQNWISAAPSRSVKCRFWDADCQVYVFAVSWQLSLRILLDICNPPRREYFFADLPWKRRLFCSDLTNCSHGDGGHWAFILKKQFRNQWRNCDNLGACKIVSFKHCWKSVNNSTDKYFVPKNSKKMCILRHIAICAKTA